MPQKFRLSRSEFSKIRGFKRYNSAFFALSYGRIEGRPTAGGVCVISTKTARKASDRVLVKRRCRAILSKFLLQRPAGEVYILIAKKAIISATFKDLEQDALQLLVRATSTL